MTLERFDSAPEQRLWMGISYGGSLIAVTELEPSKP
jgi:hypothetical protein